MSHSRRLTRHLLPWEGGIACFIRIKNALWKNSNSKLFVFFLTWHNLLWNVLIKMNSIPLVGEMHTPASHLNCLEIMEFTCLIIQPPWRFVDVVYYFWRMVTTTSGAFQSYIWERERRREIRGSPALLFKENIRCLLCISLIYRTVYIIRYPASFLTLWMLALFVEKLDKNKNKQKKKMCTGAGRPSARIFFSISSLIQFYSRSNKKKKKTFHFFFFFFVYFIKNFNFYFI